MGLQKVGEKLDIISELHHNNIGSFYLAREYYVSAMSKTFAEIFFVRRPLPLVNLQPLMYAFTQRL